MPIRVWAGKARTGSTASPIPSTSKAASTVPRPSSSAASSSSEGLPTNITADSSESVYTDSVENRGDTDTQSTSYAAIESVPMHAAPFPSPPSPPPEAAASYAAALRSPPPSRPPTPTLAPTRPAAPTATRSPAPATHALKGYPPIIVECMTKWPAHFAELRKRLGHPPNARAFDKGVRFTPQTADEFRAVQRYLTEAASTDTKLSWWCYSVASERPQKAAIRGLPVDTEPEDIVAALKSLDFPATLARAIPTRSTTRPGVYHIQLDPMTKTELERLYTVTELLNMPGISIEAWRGHTTVPQCHRCQGFGHSSVHCHRPAKCVRCGGPHFASTCTMPEGGKPSCANCQGQHTANSRSCPVYRREARRRLIQVPGPLPPLPTAERNQRNQRQPRALRVPSSDRPGRRAPPAQARPTVPPQARSAVQRQAKTTAPPQAWLVPQPVYQIGPTLQPPVNPATQRGAPPATRTKKGRNRRKKREQRPAPVAASTPLPQQHQHAFVPFAPNWRPNTAPLHTPTALYPPALQPPLAPAAPFFVPGTHTALGPYARHSAPFAPFVLGQAHGPRPGSRGPRHRRGRSRSKADQAAPECMDTAPPLPQVTTSVQGPASQQEPSTTAALPAPTATTVTATITTATAPELRLAPGAPRTQGAPELQKPIGTDPRRHFVPVTRAATTPHTEQPPRVSRPAPTPHAMRPAHYAPYQLQHQQPSGSSASNAPQMHHQQRAFQAPPPGFLMGAPSAPQQQPYYNHTLSARDPMYAILGILVDLLTTIAAGGELRDAAMRGLASINGCLYG